MEEAVKTALNEIRPMLQADGGDVEFLSVSDDGKVSVRLTGACGSCPFAMETLKGYVQESLRMEVDPEIVVERCD